MSYESVRDILLERLREPAPGRVQIVTGPRQVGKTTLLLEIARQWGSRSLYLAADAPEASLPGWWEQQWRQAEQLTHAGPALVLLDEAPYLPNWSRLLKAQSDRIARDRLPIHVIVSGSAALRLSSGTRESMAGRFERLVLTHWSARDLGHAFGLSREEAIDYFVRFGGFPGGVSLRKDLPRWQAYIRDAIIDPAIGRDLLALEAVRNPALLRQVFAVCCGHPSEIISVQKIQGSLTDSGTLGTLSHYLQLLGESYLVAALPKWSAREMRRRASPPKLVPLSNAFLTLGSQQEPPTRQGDPALWGRWLENACLAFLCNSGQNVQYWRREPVEVDAVIEGSWGRRAIESKTGSWTTRDLAGLLEFCRQAPDYSPLVICDDSDIDMAARAGVQGIAWQDFLWNGITQS